MARVVRVTAEEVREGLRTAVEAEGLNHEWLADLAEREGDAAVKDWLREHNFWNLEDHWASARFLLGE